MMRRVAVGLMGVVAWALSGALAAAVEPSPSAVAQAEERQRDEKRVRQEMLESLEPMREASPELYARQKAQLEREWLIFDLVEAVHTGELDRMAAEQRLLPLVRAEIEENAATIELDLDDARRRLHELEEIQRNPKAAVRTRIDRLLGPAGLAQPTQP